MDLGIGVPACLRMISWHLHGSWPYFESRASTSRIFRDVRCFYTRCTRSLRACQSHFPRRRFALHLPFVRRPGANYVEMYFKTWQTYAAGGLAADWPNKWCDICKRDSSRASVAVPTSNHSCTNKFDLRFMSV